MYLDFPRSHFSFISESYVQNLEGSGALILPLNYTADLRELKRKMREIHGLFFMGGSAQLFFSKDESIHYTKYAQVS